MKFVQYKKARYQPNITWSNNARSLKDQPAMSQGRFDSPSPSFYPDKSENYLQYIVYTYQVVHEHADDDDFLKVRFQVTELTAYLNPQELENESRTPKNTPNKKRNGIDSQTDRQTRWGIAEARVKRWGM